MMRTRRGALVEEMGPTATQRSSHAAAAASAAGKVELKLRPWRDGTAHLVTSHLVMSPLEFMQRLAALAPNAKLRPLVVPQGPLEQEKPATEADSAAECEVGTVPTRPQRSASAGRGCSFGSSTSMHTFSNCGAGEPAINAAILKLPVIEKILMHLGLNP